MLLLRLLRRRRRRQQHLLLLLPRRPRSSARPCPPGISRPQPPLQHLLLLLLPLRSPSHASDPLSAGAATTTMVPGPSEPAAPLPFPSLLPVEAARGTLTTTPPPTGPTSSAVPATVDEGASTGAEEAAPMAPTGATGSFSTAAAATARARPRPAQAEEATATKATSWTPLLVYLALVPREPLAALEEEAAEEEEEAIPEVSLEARESGAGLSRFLQRWPSPRYRCSSQTALSPCLARAARSSSA